MSLLEETRQLLKTYKISPNRLMGQNFLIDSSIFHSLASHANLTLDDAVLDIGAGFGFLTRFLAMKSRIVFAVEKDAPISHVLEERLKDVPNVRIISGDVLIAAVPEFDKVVAAPPYQISSPLLMWLFNREFSCAVLVLQKDFAERVVAEVGSESYSWLTVYTHFQAKAEVLEDVPRERFCPEPEVDSVVLRLTPYSEPPFKLRNSTLFARLLKHVFSERNKKVNNAVLPFAKNTLGLSLEDAKLRLSKLSFSQERVRALPPEAFGELAHAFID
jgi:16S rRNA (adenine1518-N6/adenine1519-N6)-dimethyltransferase